MTSKYNEFQKLLTERSKLQSKKITRSTPKEGKVVAPLKIRLSSRKKRKNDDSDDEGLCFSDILVNNNNF